MSNENLHEAAATAFGVTLPLCTGIAASWCPNCGDCTCPRESNGEWLWGDAEAMRKAEQRRGPCPIHSAGSRHVRFGDDS